MLLSYWLEAFPLDGCVVISQLSYCFGLLSTIFGTPVAWVCSRRCHCHFGLEYLIGGLCSCIWGLSLLFRAAVHWFWVNLFGGVCSCVATVLLVLVVV